MNKEIEENLKKVLKCVARDNIGFGDYLACRKVVKEITDYINRLEKENQELKVTNKQF